MENNLKSIIGSAKPKKAKKEKSYGGLKNFGNSCYCNVVIQSLFNTPLFKQFLDENIDSAYDFPEKCTTLITLSEIFDQYSSKNHKLAANLIFKLEKLFDPSGQQNDASEFLNFIFDKVNEESSTFSKADEEEDEWVEVAF